MDIATKRCISFRVLTFAMKKLNFFYPHMLTSLAVYPYVISTPVIYPLPPDEYDADDDGRH